MSSRMDIDASLDDLIKKRKSTKYYNNNNNNNNKRAGNNKNQAQARPPIQTKKAKITKYTSPQRSNINLRLNKPSGPVFTTKNKPTQNKADPSKIIITKNIATKTAKKPSAVLSRVGPSLTKKTEIKSMIANRLGSSNISIVNKKVQPPVPSFQLSSVENRGGFSIRGRSNTANASTRPITIKGESGPTTVLITGLDPGTNSEDVKISFEQFGNILHCEVLRNRSGHSYGEAEIEFSTKSAALDCIAVMDNQIADGHSLRVILRETRTPQVYSEKQVRSLIQPSFTPSGKMYSDQMKSRYDIQRL